MPAGSTPTRVLVLGAGFGGLELTALLADALGDRLELTLVDRGDAFVFGFSKLDVLFGRCRLDEVRAPYAKLDKPGVRFVPAEVTAIDAEARRAETTAGAFEADYLVIALGAGYDLAATPGLTEGGFEFYSVAGAARAATALAGFTRGRAVVGICAAPFKCPPAPSETALLLHDYLCTKGVREACEISLVMPFQVPVPPSPDTSRALLDAFARRGISFVPNKLVSALDAARKVVVLNDDTELPCDLLLAVPKHRVPSVVAECGLVETGWIPVNPKTLATKLPRVYAIGDVTSVGTPKAGVFAEGAARVVAARITAEVLGGDEPAAYTGAGSCYVEFGGEKVGRVDVDFFSGEKPTGSWFEPSTDLVKEKKEFGASRLARWFGS